MRQRLKLGDRVFIVDVVGKEPYAVRIEENEEGRNVDPVGRLEPGEGRVVLDGRPVPYFVTDTPKGVWLTLAGKTVFLEKVKAGAQADGEHGGFEAPMPGKVIKVMAEGGQAVKKGDVLVIMEAMKMEHRMEAPADGEVIGVHCEEGQLVDQGFVLLDFQADSSA